MAASVLRARPAVFIGLISYSLYLWHWPLLVLLEYRLLRPLYLLESIALLLVLAIVATLCWRYVEQPFRQRPSVPRESAVGWSAAGAVTLAVLAGLSLHWMKGVPGRVEPGVVTLEVARNNAGPFAACANLPPADVARGAACRLGGGNASPSFLVWGDSHAMSLAPAISLAAARHGKTGYLVVYSGCSSLLDVRMLAHAVEKLCTEGRQAVRELLRLEGIESVLLAARWAMYERGTLYTHEGIRLRRIADDQGGGGSVKENGPVFTRGLMRTAATLQGLGKKAYFVESIPEIGWNVPNILARAQMFATPVNIAPTREEYRSRQQPVLASVRRVQERYPLSRISLEQVFCATPRCAVMDGDKPLYIDSNHLALPAAVKAASVFDPVFR
jgi:hypothetical protein